MASAGRAVAWLLKQQGPDGGWSVLDVPMADAYYKAGWAFALMGETAAAERSFDFVKRNLQKSDGDFAPRSHLWHREITYQYANGWFIAGAQKLGRYDVSMPAMQFLLTQQHPEHGGFYSQRAEAGERRRSDTMSTGIAGVACLATGHIGAARKVADCYNRMIEMQPAPEERFYTTLEADGRLGIQFPADETRWRVVDATQADQCDYAVGLPFAYAVLLHEATGEQRYAELAQWFFEFQTRSVNPWDGSSGGKAAWGCSKLYRKTGDRRYKDIALHVARSFMACQTPEGWVQWGLRAASYGETTEPGGEGHVFTYGDFDITSEYVVWLGLIGSNLLARDGEV